MTADNKIEFARYCPFLTKADSGNLVSVHFDSSSNTVPEAACNHSGMPRVEVKPGEVVKFQSQAVATCNGCEDLPEGFEKPLEIEVKASVNV